MAIIYRCSALLLLTALSAAGPSTPNAGCTYRGKAYSNLDTIPHDNGCAILQCQFGQVVIYREACGKDVDGNCHRLNMMYIHKEATYHCQKVLVGQTYEYRNEVVIPANADCIEGSKTFKHMDTFVRPGGCQEYQCQRGQAFPLNEGCDGTIDGKCHLVGELYTKGTKTYNCTTRDNNGVTLYVNTELTTSRQNRDCVRGDKTYKDLELFRLPNMCTIVQCQDKSVKVLAKDCKSKEEEGKCFASGQGWTYGELRYECTPDQQGTPRTTVTFKGFRKCDRAEKLYNHLDIETRAGGCVKTQCQNGATPTVEGACGVSGPEKCQELNIMYKQGPRTFKCTGDGVVELDEFGNVIEKEVVTFAPPVFKETCPDLAADIIFVWDSSGSIARGNYARQLNFSCDIASAFKVGPNHVQFGGVVFSSTAEKRFDLNSNHNFEEVCKDIRSTPYMRGLTETQAAFDVILEEGMFLPDAGGRPDVPKIVIVITDGASNNTAITVAAAGQIKALGTQIISVGVGQVSIEELNGIASRPGNVFNISNYNAIFELRGKLAERVCTVPTDPPVIPEEPTPPIKCPNSVADILFILDSSLGVGSENYQKKLDLAVNITNMFTVSPKAVQVGAVLVGTQPKTAFNLNTHSSTAAVTKAIQGFDILNGGRELDDAIQSIITQGLYSKAKGGRDSAARIAVIIVDGPPTDWANSLPLAKQLRNLGVRVITIGIGNIQMKKLTGLSGNTRYVFASPSYDLLTFTKALLYQRLCAATKLPRPEPEPPRCTDTEVPPCDHICSNTETGFDCACRIGFLTNEQNKFKCDDIDECTKPTSCQQICENTEGSYTCLCNKGFAVSPDDASKCLDINECDSNPCQATCTNTEGSYACTCNEGYQISADDPTVCEETDRCKREPCEQICKNTPGGFNCSCLPGYVIDKSDPAKCRDEDECQDTENPPCHQKCTNTEGSYSCSCRKGYVPNDCDPNSCRDINECELGVCSDECTNTRGGYLCS